MRVEGYGVLLFVALGTVHSFGRIGMRITYFGRTPKS